MVPSPFDSRRDLDVTDLVAAVGLGCCVCFGSATALDVAFGTNLWPPGAEYGSTLLLVGSLYWPFLRRLRPRERAVSVGLLTVAACALVAAVYTNPEGPLMPVTVVALSVGGVVGWKGVVESFGTSRSTGH
jgi:hypothetical protein